MRRCRKCGKGKPAPAFGFMQARTRTICRECDAARRKAARQKRKAKTIKDLHRLAADQADEEAARLQAENQLLRERLSLEE